MANYLAMETAALLSEKENLLQQYEAMQKKGLSLDMSRGKPEADQLSLSDGMQSITVTLDAKGNDTRNYGLLEGVPEAREFFAEILGAKEEETFVGGNSSLMLMYNMIDFGWRKGFPDSPKPWKDCGTIKFLCPSPGYDRHFRITEDFGFELITVDMTPDGPDMDQVEKLVQDEAVKGIWCIPVYSNPDGYVYSDQTVQRLAAMKTAAPDFKIFWDNAYVVHHLTQKKNTCANILDACRAAGCETRPLMFCSTSKITYAGAGVGAMAACPQNLKAAAQYMFAMTIGFDKVSQLRHVWFLKQVGLEQQMAKHAAMIGPKFQSVIDSFHKELDSCGEIARWTEPEGGYFISLYVMKGCAKRVVELCKDAGVVLTGAGAAYPYGKDLNDTHIRIAPTYPSAQQLAEATEVLCTAIRLASIEKLLTRN